MLSLVGISEFVYRLVDINSLKIYEKSKAELMDYLLSGNKVDNIEANSKYTHFNGTNGNLSRYKDGIKSNSVVVLFKSSSSNGTIYCASNSLGKVVRLDEDALIREGRKYTLANGAIANIGSGKTERVIVKSLKGSFREVTEKNYEHLDLEDYIKLHRQYNKISNDCDSSDATGTVINTFNGGFVHEKKIGEPDFENFLTNYKIVQAMISRDRLYKCEKVYSYYLVETDGSKVRLTFKGLVGYLVTFKKWHAELLIPAFDKNLTQRFNKDSISNLRFKDLRKLFTYNREEPTANDSARASIQICEGFNKEELKHFKGELIKTGKVEVRMQDDFTFNLGELPKVKLKYSLNIKSRDIRAMRAKLMK